MTQTPSTNQIKRRYYDRSSDRMQSEAGTETPTRRLSAIFATLIAKTISRKFHIFIAFRALQSEPVSLFIPRNKAQIMDCKRCGSWELRRSRSKDYFFPLCVLFPFARCRDCSYRFRVPFWQKMDRAPPVFPNRRNSNSIACGKRKSLTAPLDSFFGLRATQPSDQQIEFTR